MKYGLLTYIPQKGKINIGDYIQSLAAKQFIGEYPIYVNREHLDTYQGENICIILNGWFMHYPKNFPPSNSIIPIFISFHINIAVEDIFFKNINLKYFKQYEPIGCRDLYTRDILRKHGINAYFSGCLTLTLGNTYKQTEERKYIYFVDPYLGNKKDIRNILSAIKTFVFNKKKIYKLAYLKYQKISFFALLSTSLFYNQYKIFWSDDVLFNAIYIGHYIASRGDDGNFKYADELLKKYVNAKLVITSRIHAALPTIGMNTPCIFVKPTTISKSDKSRFPGLLDFFNIMIHTGTSIKNDRHINTLKPEIKNNFLKYKKLLIESLTTKMSDIEKYKHTIE
jgi:hypothetical protein